MFASPVDLWWVTQTMPRTTKRTTRSPHLATFVDGLQSSGRYTFDRTQAGKALRISDAALESSLRRLVAKRRIARVRRGFYVVVPLEHAAAGAPPASWFIDDLMRRHLEVPYYVGLLSAAALHGASHQAPRSFRSSPRGPSGPRAPDGAGFASSPSAIWKAPRLAR
jgi:hypothetical protein